WPARGAARSHPTCVSDLHRDVDANDVALRECGWTKRDRQRLWADQFNQRRIHSSVGLGRAWFGLGAELYRGRGYRGGTAYRPADGLALALIADPRALSASAVAVGEGAQLRRFSGGALRVDARMGPLARRRLIVASPILHPIHFTRAKPKAPIKSHDA